MQAYKVTRNDGSVYFARDMHGGWRLRERANVVAVEPQEETPEVRASIIFDSGVAGPWDAGLRARTIARMVAGDCLWHACAQETGKRCFCAACQPVAGWVG